MTVSNESLTKDFTVEELQALLNTNQTTLNNYRKELSKSLNNYYKSNGVGSKIIKRGGIKYFKEGNVYYNGHKIDFAFIKINNRVAFATANTFVCKRSVIIENADLNITTGVSFKEQLVKKLEDNGKHVDYHNLVLLEDRTIIHKYFKKMPMIVDFKEIDNAKIEKLFAEQQKSYRFAKRLSNEIATAKLNKFNLPNVVANNLEKNNIVSNNITKEQYDKAVIAAEKDGLSEDLMMNNLHHYLMMAMV